MHDNIFVILNVDHCTIVSPVTWGGHVVLGGGLALGVLLGIAALPVQEDSIAISDPT